MSAAPKAVLVALLPQAERALTLGFGYLKQYADGHPELTGGARISLVERASEEPLETVLAEILAPEPDLVGFHVQLCNEDVVAATVRALLAEHPEVRVVLGGQEATHHPERLLRATGADAVVLGEGEQTFAELLGRVHSRPRWLEVDGLVVRRGETMVRTDPRPPPDELSAIGSPFEDAAVLRGLQDLPAAVLETTRGCPFSCRYCSWPNDTRPRHFPLDRVQREIQTLLSVKPDFLVHMADPDIFLYPDRARVILGAIRQHDPQQRSQWWFNTYLGNMTAELAALCDHRGFVLEGGLQTTNPEALKVSNRRFDADAVVRAVGLLQEHAPRARLAVQLILGLPGDTLEGFYRSLDWVCRLRVREVHVFHMQVMPNTPFHRSLESFQIDADPRSPYGLRSHKTFSAEDVREGRRASLRLSLLGRFTRVWDLLLEASQGALVPRRAAELTRYADARFGLGLEAALDLWEREDCRYLTPLTGGEDPAPAQEVVAAAEAWFTQR